MASILDDLRAHRQVTEETRTNLTEVTSLLGALSNQVRALAADTELRQLLQQEHAWLSRAEALVREVRRFREAEIETFWPAVWRRWAMAILFAVIGAWALGAGYAWETTPYRAEIADLQERAAFGDEVVARVVHMTPDEKKRFDGLMKASSTGNR